MKKRGAFTLVELLVVIAVIALLMAILMPALQKVRRMGRATVCRSNVRQWGLIFRLYAQDNESKLPQSIAGGSLSAQEAYWIIATLSYYKNKEIRMCPSTKVIRGPVDRSHGGTLAAWGPFPSGGSGDWWADFDTGSYGLNEWAACPPPGVSTYWGGAPTDKAWGTVLAKGADRVPLFLDCVYVGGFPVDDRDQGAPLDFEPPPYEWQNSWGDWPMDAHAMRLFCLPRHEGAVNAVFLDGSVGPVPLRALWRLKWHRSFDVNGPWTKRHSHWPDWLLRYRDEY